MELLDCQAQEGPPEMPLDEMVHHHPTDDDDATDDDQLSLTALLDSFRLPDSAPAPMSSIFNEDAAPCMWPETPSFDQRFP